jgi:predicted RNA-binding Zn ribbon-like protein
MTSHAGISAVLLPGPDEPTPVLLMNTIWADRAGVHDALTTPSELSAWLKAVGHRLFSGGDRAAATIRAIDVDEFRRLRVALRRLAAELTHDTRPRALASIEDQDPEWAASLLNTVSAAAPSARTMQWPERVAQLSPPAGVRPPVAALAAIAGTAVGLFAGPDSPRLRACQAPGCVLYFVKDHPRREWCSTACGNRARAARHYRRHRGATDDTAAPQGPASRASHGPDRS